MFARNLSFTSAGSLIPWQFEIRFLIKFVIGGNIAGNSNQYSGLVSSNIDPIVVTGCGFFLDIEHIVKTLKTIN